MFLTSETDFGLNMLRQTPLNESVVVSPISVLFTLAMLHAGAKGKTKAQINEVIGIGASDDSLMLYFCDLLTKVHNSTSGVQSQIANGFFLNKQYKIEKNFEETISTKLHTKIEVLNFTNSLNAAKIINAFVSEATGGKIHEMVNDDTVRDTFSLLINAVYFSGDWLERFYNSSNTKGLFYSEEKTNREVEFMNDHDVYKDYAENDEVEVLSLPYKDTTYAFNIILPKKRFGLESVRSKIDGEEIQKLLFELEPAHVSIRIPKIKIETDYKLKEALVNMGVSEIFSDSSNLSNIAKDPPLKVSQASHKAIIEVQEEGTTASAATLFKIIPKKAIVDEPKKFVVDHPFLFILTKNNNPLFIGQFV
ncbi:serine proteinase inhibitor [Dictyocaulus viviparus]|uniref:Serine proteinase inhibitor n=1 Tax=Dictyocaulus viviparus TaxID=29172 RepID=A0A0D8YGG3_DICVI|nr:serine proteinase inhibitor [Dictyocaulus viviparus]